MHGLFDQGGHRKPTVQELCNVEKNGVRRPVPLEADEFQGLTTTEGKGSTTATKIMTGKFGGRQSCPTENLAQFRCEYREGYRGGVTEAGMRESW